MFESFRSLSNPEIISGSKAARAQEHGGMLSGLGYLVEIERRGIHLELGYSSVFDYCLNALEYSESQAQRRITVARCVVRFPEIFPLLEKHEVNLGTVARVSKILTADNCSMVLARIRKKSLREVEAIAAEYDPEPVLPRDRVRTIVVRVRATAANVAQQGEPGLLGENHLRNEGKKPATLETATAASEPSTATKTLRDLERFKRVEFTARDATMIKLERIRSLASHRLAMNATMEQLIDFMADYFLKREDPVQRQQRREAKAPKPAVPSSNPRHIPAAVRDQVHVRDGRCTYVGPDGKRCNSPHVLQVDHVKPVARKGAAVLGNLRLLCAYHNRLESDRLMGKRHVIRESNAQYAAWRHRVRAAAYAGTPRAPEQADRYFDFTGAGVLT